MVYLNVAVLWLNKIWEDRWLFLFFGPLLVGLVVSIIVLWTGPTEGSELKGSRSKRIIQNKDLGVDLAAKLTFLGTAVAAGAQLDIFKKAEVVDSQDLGVFLIVNIVFTAIAASHSLVLDLPLGKVLKDKEESFKDRWTRAMLIWSSVGSLTSIAFIVWKSQATFTPLYAKIALWIFLAVAAFMVSTYVRVRLPEAPRADKAAQKKAEKQAKDATEQAPQL